MTGKKSKVRKELQSAQTSAYQRLTKKRSRITSLLYDQPALAREELREFDRILAECRRSHDAYLDVLDDPDDLDMEADKFESRYQAATAFMAETKRALEGQPPPPTAQAKRPDAPSLNPDAAAFVKHTIPAMPAGLDALSGLLAALQLPTPDIRPFTGDVRDYTTFIAAFDARIASKVQSPRDLLYYLDQYLKGQPKDLIQSSFYLDPATGYETARNILEQEYGNAYKISMSYLNELNGFKSIKADDPDSLKRFSVLLTKSMHAMSNLTHLDVLDHPYTMQGLVSKLPNYLINRWRDHVTKMRKPLSMPPFRDLVEFVHLAAEAACHPVFGQNALKRESSTSSAAATPKSSASAASSKHGAFSTAAFERKSCKQCGESTHELDKCTTFLQKSLEDRRAFVMEHRLCFACLFPGHRSRECKHKKQCAECGKAHPSSLHSAPRPRLNGRSAPTPQRDRGHVSPPESSVNEDDAGSHAAAAAATPPLDNVTGFATSANTGTARGKIVHAIVPVQVSQEGSNRSVMTYAFIDNGSTACFVTDELLTSLQTTGEDTTIQLRTMHGTEEVSSSIVKGLRVTALDGSDAVCIDRAYSRDVIPVDHDQIPTARSVEGIPSLGEVASLLPPYFADLHIGLLIGLDCPKALQPLRVVTSSPEGPFAVRLPLGWTVYGPLCVDNVGNGQVHVNFTNIHEVTDCKELVSPASVLRMFERDFADTEVGIDRKGPSQEDRKFIEIVDEGYSFDGKITIPMPFRNNEGNDIPNNRPLALKRALLQRTKMLRDDGFRSDYVNFIDDLLQKGYASEVPANEVDGGRWYLPHHGVYNVNKGKIRVVFDCSARYRGSSLNDALLQGPDLTNGLVGVLTRFREKRIAFIGDIESMFHQVMVPNHQKRFLRFLWWPNGNLAQPVREYQMNVHVFGATSSPSVANYALRSVASDPCSASVRDTILRNFYVDDCLKSVDTEEEAIALVAELSTACQQKGFHLRKFVSNSQRVLSSIPPQERSTKTAPSNLGDKVPIEKALGIRWNIDEDAFSFAMKIDECKPTRRGILASVSSVYDPLGFVAPYVLIAKLTLQQLCKQNVKDWDAPVADEIRDSWNSWTEQLPQLQDLKIPRCFVPSNFKVFSRELHVFADASTRGYGAVIYLRLEDSNGEVAISFVMGKARVAPLKFTSVPRLELTAAVTALKLAEKVKGELSDEEISCHYHTDSTTVLFYIRSNDKRWPIFVANRVNTIREFSRPSQWRYVPSAFNPADEASRGICALDLRSAMWLQGPAFLKSPRAEWPPEPSPQPALSLLSSAGEEDPSHTPMDQLMEHPSDWRRLKTFAAVFLKVKVILLDRAMSRKGHVIVQRHSILSPSDVQQAATPIIRWVQSRTFPLEFAALSDNGGKLLKTSNLKSLDPFMENGVLRVGGRLRKANLSDTNKNPVILPGKNHITSLIIRREHCLLGHVGRSHVLSSLRQRYWIIRGNSAVRRVIGGCVTCKRLIGRVQSQKMADLPECRLDDQNPPFTHTGVDYFGPFEVKDRRSIVKRWGVVFTCMSSRAVHLEVAASLDTDSCLHALRRLIARRGAVHHIYSDNGTNFVGATKELQRKLDHLQWHFNPPTASHFGGAWERMVKSVKAILNAMLLDHGQRLDVESLHTLLCEVEAIINSRPITALSDDSRDPEPLTPNHILTGKTQVCLTNPGAFQREDLYLRKRWRAVQHLATVFWHRWRREYLALLQARRKWQDDSPNLVQGDVALVKADASARSEWPVGVVTAVHPDDQGRVRVVDIRVKGHIVQRPVAKLIYLCH